MNKKRLKQLEEEIKKKTEILNRYEYEHFILSLDHNELFAYIQMKDDKIKKLENKLKQINKVLHED